MIVRSEEEGARGFMKNWNGLLTTHNLLLFRERLVCVTGVTGGKSKAREEAPRPKYQQCGQVV